MNSQAYNLLWLNLNFPDEATRNAEKQRQPMPSKIAEDILAISERNPEVDTRLWIDSRRLTEPQIDWFGRMVKKCSTKNLSLQDLCTIENYAKNFLFNQAETSPHLRFSKHSLIWRQVDTARLLICLQGDYDQVFYSDTDISNLVINSSEVQEKMARWGIIVGTSAKGGVENQLFGFNRQMRGFFQKLYADTLDRVIMNEENGYNLFHEYLIEDIIKRRLHATTEEVGFITEHSGESAHYTEELIETSESSIETPPTFNKLY